MKKIKSLLAMTAAICAVSSSAAFADNMDKQLEVGTQVEEDLDTCDPKASSYFDGYSNHLYSNEKGYVKAQASADVTFSVDEVVIRVQLQKYDRGWKNVGSEYSISSTSLLCDFSKSIRVTSGVKYRSKCYFDAYVDGEIVETKTLTSDAVVAK